jgi:hypothetical protein
MRTYLIKSLLFILLLAPAACTDYNITVPQVSSQTALMMDVANIEITPYQGADIQVLPTPASTMAKQWFERKIKISNRGENRFEIDIVNARTDIAPRSSHPKFQAYITEIKVNYRLYIPTQNLPIQTAESSFKMVREVKKNASIAERDKFFANVNRELLERMDKNFPAQIEKYFSNYILMTR